MLVILVIVFAVGVIFLTTSPPGRKKSRKDFLESLRVFLDGKLEPIEGSENAFRIRFTHEGKEFVYEDHEEEGIKEVVFRSYLKTKTASRLTLNFMEKETGHSFKSDVVLISGVNEESAQKDVKVKIPKLFEVFSIITNNPTLTNNLFSDTKVVSIFSEFKNVDHRGHPFMALKIIEGMIILEFHPSGSLFPPPLSQHNNIPMIEKYLDSLNHISSKLV